MLRAHRRWLPAAVALLAVLVIMPAAASETDAANGRWTANCQVRLRTAPGTTARVRWVIAPGAVVTTSGTVRGGRWSADCGGRVGGATWLRVVAVNGRSTTSLLGRSYVYAASGLFRQGVTPPPPPVAAPTAHLANCDVRLRTGASTTAATKAIISEDTSVTRSGTVSGSSWAAECSGDVAGSTWHRITAVGGRSVSSLYGVSVVYAASGLFRAVTSTSGYLEGIDVSKWQGTIDWPSVRAAGKRFVMAKATEGVGYEDSTYSRNRSGARAAGLKFGAYHFARPGRNDPVREADWFVDTARYERGMLIPALDLEETGGLSSTALTAWVRAWLERVEARLGVKAMIYANPSFWRNSMADTRWFGDNGYRVMWVAHWGVGSPNVPAANWAGRSWTFWQYTSDGVVPGIQGRVDLNRYRHASFAPVTY